MHDQRATILIVDDNEMNRDVLSRRVERMGHQVIMAEDGEAALALTETTPFDLILLDIMMPKLNGYQVLEVLKADPARQLIPVIVVSALDELESVVKCIELGAEDYLFKPFNPILLKARVASCLEKKRLLDAAAPHAYTESSAQATALLSGLMERLTAFAAGSAGSLTAAQAAEVEAIVHDLLQLAAYL